MLNSIWGRLLLANLILLPLVLSALAFALWSAHASSQIQSIQSQLLLSVYTLISDAEWEEGQLSMPEQAADPTLNQPSSQQGAWILNQRGDVLWQSQSMLGFDRSLPLDMPKEAGVAIYSGEEYPLVLSFKTIWGDDSELVFVVFQSTSFLKKNLGDYQLHLMTWLGGIGILLILVQLFALRFGLKPMSNLNAALDDIEQGHSNGLDGHFADELNPMVFSMNRLIASQQKQRDRYKQSLGNLAHSLKTPLAILASEHASPDEKVGQIQRMNDWIRYHLNRSSGGGAVLGDQRVLVRETVYRISEAMKKVYADKAIQISTMVEDDVYFIGDPDDLFEVLGNLVDNAAKYGRDKVSIAAHYEQTNLVFRVEDNGPGIPQNQIQKILERGGRLDEQLPGQGIGLSVVSDIVSSYDGSIDIGASNLGGILMSIKLPQAHLG